MSAIPSPEQRHLMIEEAAYFRAEHRGFQGGSPIEDWLAAKADIDRMLGSAIPARGLGGHRSVSGPLGGAMG